MRGVAGSNPVAQSIHSTAFLFDLALFWRQVLWQRQFFIIRKKGFFAMTDLIIFQKSPMPIEVEEGKT